MEIFNRSERKCDSALIEAYNNPVQERIVKTGDLSTKERGSYSAINDGKNPHSKKHVEATEVDVMKRIDVVENGYEESVLKRVFVSAISSMQDFHVVPVRDLAHLYKIESDLNPPESTIWEEKEPSRTFDCFGHNENNYLFSAPCAKTGIRGRAMLLSPECSSDKNDVLIRFVDTGDTATVSKESFLELPTNLLNRNKLAIRCSMFNCREWSEECNEVFTNLVVGKVWRLELMGIEKDTGVLQVDLCCQIDNKITSVRDVLLFSDHVKFQLPGQHGWFPDIESRSFIPPTLLCLGDVQSVILSHVEGEKIYVQLLTGEGREATLALPYLMEALSQVYNVRKSEEMWELGNPRPGVPCALQDKKDSLWYRGQVVKIIRARLILVLLVDFGSTLIVPVHQIRILFPQFLEVPVVAQPVKLQSSGVLSTCDLMSRLGLREMDLEVVGVEGEVELSIEGWSVNRWLHERPGPG